MKRVALPVWVILAYLRLAYSACPGEWFGLNCQYKCRCTEDKCDPVTGTCLGGARCQLGWFGPECQYVDLAHSYAALDYPFPVDVVVDGKEDTCADVSDVTLSLTVPLQLSWFRAYVGDSYYRDKLNIQFKEQINSPLLACENKRTALVSDTAVDIHCDLDIEVTQVILKFDSVQSLCSFYISGGRNVALRQQTSQSSDYDVKFAPASNAVNGNTSKGYFTGSCTHTKLGDSEPTWNVTIDKPRAVNRYVIHNRDEGNHIKNRLIGFHLTSYDSAGAEVFHVIDRTPNAQNVYTVTSPTKEVQTVSIYVQKVEGALESPLLNLCEVEVYGDSVCESGLYGRDCEHKCNCADSNNTCFVSTGGCPYGCPPGFQGDSCAKGCDRQTYGQDCNSTCPQHCEILNTILSVCHHISGVCTQGCLPGYKGDRCDKRCDRQTYGPDCKSTCPQHCKNLNTSLSVCHHISGVCTQGCLPGYKGARCDERCDRQTYGQDCNSTCPQYCEILNTSLSVCHHISGVCTQGCLPGYKGARCDERCDRQTYGQDCNSTCPQHCEILNTSLSVCHHISGVCTQGCLPGYKGARCDERCDRQTYGQDCNSTCPQHCENLNTSLSVCHHISGVCTQGCLPGYKGDRCDKRCDRQTYGQDCNSTCPQHCENLNTSLSVCHHISGVCTQGCLPGYKGARCDKRCDRQTHGQDCNSTCPQHCENLNTSLSVCHHISGVCTQGCLPGYKGDRCDKRCDRQTHGQDCNSTCPQHCENLNTSLSVCHHISGVCTQGCLPGYKGDRCDERCDRQTHGQDCNSTCPQHCENLNTSLSVCHHISGVCTQGCLPGYKGDRCDERCDRQTHGQDCNSTCPQHCENLNTSLSVCHHISGVCTQGCLPGYKGDRCDERCDRQTHGQDCNSTCPQHCENLNTSLSVCHHISGVCTQGCLPGYKGDRCDERCDRQIYGQDCNSTCPQHCGILNTSLSVCHHISGVCTQGCLPGYKGARCDERCDRQIYGQDCNSTCPQHCGILNTSLSVCHHISGVCTQGCLPGYKGARCDERCDRQTYGQDCNSTCPQHCEILNTSLSVCHHISGVCTQGCLPGYKGARCDEQCNRQTHGQDCNYTCIQHCENLNTSLFVCHHISGVCTQGCLPGYKGIHCDEQCDSQTHGQDCNSTCSQHCENLNTSLSVCHHISGVCTQGCLPGYSGIHCHEQCDRGTYGLDCNSTCPQHCENMNTSPSVCHHISGVCSQGCLPGLKGVHCDESKTNTARKEDSSPGYSTTLWAVAGCIIVVVLVVVGLIVLWKFKNLKSYTIWTYSCKNLQKSDSTEMIVTKETSVVDDSVFH